MGILCLNTAGYEYDFHGRLVRENNKKAGTTKLYYYDEGGNITEEQEYPYTKAVTIQEKPERNITYSYRNKTWKDLLTEYQGEKITYDELGNPLQYTDGEKFTWTDGKKLTGICEKENKIQYVYNSENQSIKKIVNGKEAEYNWDEENLIQLGA